MNRQWIKLFLLFHRSALVPLTPTTLPCTPHTPPTPTISPPPPPSHFLLIFLPSFPLLTVPHSSRPSPSSRLLYAASLSPHTFFSKATLTVKRNTYAAFPVSTTICSNRKSLVQRRTHTSEHSRSNEGSPTVSALLKITWRYSTFEIPEVYDIVHGRLSVYRGLGLSSASSTVLETLVKLRTSAVVASDHQNSILRDYPTLPLIFFLSTFLVSSG